MPYPPSLLGKQWQLQQAPAHLDLLGKIYHYRTLLNATEIQEFLDPSLEKGLHDPFLLKNMERAVARIRNAIETHEKIIIFGDYDTDGITSTAILFDALTTLRAEVSYRLPHRLEDGYGLNLKTIQEIHKIGVKLLITVDCGIANEPQIRVAKEQGIDVIVTDHHRLALTFPDSAYAVIHPKQPGCPYPYKELTGAGVAFKLAQALINNTLSLDADQKIADLLDLAALGTIADLAPLTGENRVIVKFGLQHIESSKRPGLHFLKKIAGTKSDRKLNTHDVSFQLTPRLNAAGRIQSPYYALQLLLSSANQAARLARHLDNLNRQRQEIMLEAVTEADNLLQKEMPDAPIFIAKSPDWHIGIIGLVAGRLAEKINRPVIIMHDRGTELIGSARSPAAFNIVEALQAHAPLLEHFGGHHQAAGFSISASKLDQFIESMKQYAHERLQFLDLRPTLHIDSEISLPEITNDLFHKIDHCAPFGIGNPAPTFLLPAVTIKNLKTMGRDHKHLSFHCIQSETPALINRVTAFSFGPYFEKIHQISNSAYADLVIQLHENTWNGRSSLELQLLDLRITRFFL